MVHDRKSTSNLFHNTGAATTRDLAPYVVTLQLTRLNRGPDDDGKVLVGMWRKINSVI